MKKQLTGTVVSNRMDKTVVVAVESRFPHPKYEKMMIKTKKMHAHDAENKCQIGDLVRLQECRPLSRHKRFQVMSVLGHEQEKAQEI